MATKVPEKAKKKVTATDFISMEFQRFRLFGVWRSTDPKSFYNTWRYRCLSTLTTFLLMFFQVFGVLFIVVNRQTINVADLANALFVYCLTFIYDFMLLTILAKMKLIEELIQHTHSTLFLPRTEEETEIMDKNFKTVKIYRVIFYGGVTFSLLFISIINSFINDKKPVFVAYIPPWIGFYTFIIIQLIASLLRASLITTLNVLSAAANILLTTQLDILKERLELVTDREAVAICTQHYLDILKFKDLFMGYYAVPGLSSFMAHVIILCTTGLVFFEADAFGKIFFAVFLFALLFALFVISWHGNEVSVKSNELALSIYNSDWIGSSISHQKLLLLLTMTTSQPIEMNFAGGLASMSLPSLVWVLQTAYKCYTLMQQFN